MSAKPIFTATAPATSRSAVSLPRGMCHIALALAVLTGAAALPAPPLHAQAAPSAQPALAINFNNVNDDQLPLYIAKSNGVVGLLNTSLRASESWHRYLSWVDVKRGPTGKERIIYGLYSVSESSARDAIAKARESANAEPAIPTLDGATKDLADAFDALYPVLNEAEAYYERKDYLSDGMAGGKALHARIAPAAMKFIAARERMNILQDQFKDQLDLFQLARIEKAEGKSFDWHSRNTMRLASKAVDLMPRDPRRGADLREFDAALKAFGDATRDLDNSARESGKSSRVHSDARSILGSLREMRDDIAKGRVNGMSYSMNAQSVIMRYNMMVSMSNAFR